MVLQSAATERTLKPPHRPSLSDPQVRAKLAQLKKVGLYKGNLRKKTPTRYGKSVLNKYMDVLEGKASVITVPREVARQYRESQRVVRTKVVVPRKAVETVRYSKKDKAIYATRENEEGETYRRKIINIRVSDVSNLPELKRNQSYAVPFNRHGDIEYMYFTDKSELKSLIAQYEPKYKNMLKYVQIVEYKRRRMDDE